MVAARIVGVFLLAGALGLAATSAVPVKLRKNIKEIGLSEIDNNDLRVFCYDGEKSWSRIWSSLQFTVNSDAEEFKLVVGDNASVLMEQFNNDWSLFESLWLTDVTYQKHITIAPYASSCVGLTYHGSSAPLNCTVSLKETVISWKFPSLLIIGMMLLLSAHRMSRSVSFHYTTGVTIGIIASLLVLVYIISKLVPGRPMAYSVLFGGWAMVAWATSMMKDNLLHFITSYPHYFIIYTTLVGVASFLFCYWRGPITHTRSFQIIQWSIQLVAMTIIYHATQLREASIILVTMVILFYLMHTKLSKCIKRCYMHHVVLRWYVIFPPKRKLLTTKEYKQEGVRETAAALQELQNFCRQNTGEMYKMMAKLQSPNRFSKFLDGDFHLTDNEVQHYHHCSSQDSDNDDEI